MGTQILVRPGGRESMPPIGCLCVCCGAAVSIDMQYRKAASELGARLAEAGIELVFGGGRVGLMGLLADAALARGGRVTGIIPAHGCATPNWPIEASASSSSSTRCTSARR